MHLDGSCGLAARQRTANGAVSGGEETAVSSSSASATPLIRSFPQRNGGIYPIAWVRGIS